MPIKERARHILVELRGHAPFTLLGAALGIIFMLIFAHIGPVKSHTLFAIFHPTHVVLSAMVTASMFKLHSARKHILIILIIGYFGSIGIATLSDIIIPHFGSKILHLDIPTHANLHELTRPENAPESHENADSQAPSASRNHAEHARDNDAQHPQNNPDAHAERAPNTDTEHPETTQAEHAENTNNTDFENPEPAHTDHAEYTRNGDSEHPETAHAHPDHRIHFGFIDEWYIVNPAAFLGIFIALFLPRTKFPHAGHVLVSTWASSAYLLMNLQAQLTITNIIGAFAVLFISVWLPCCISDIVFPLLFVNSDLELAAPCPHHALHSHPHIHAPQQEDTQ